MKKLIFASFLILASVFAYTEEASDSEKNTETKKKTELEKMEENKDFFDRQKNLTIVIDSQPKNLDPHTACFVSEAQILTGLYEGLFSYNPSTAEPVPAICKSYKLSRDKKRWTFTLVDDAKFSDGSKITAATIKDSWISLLSTEDASFVSFLDGVVNAVNFREGNCKADEVGIEVKDDVTLVVLLNEPASHLPSLLCHFSLSAVSSNKNLFSGPFVLESNENGKIVLKKNMEYRNASSVALPSITFIQSDDAAETSYLYNNGLADWADGTADGTKIINEKSIHVNNIFGTTYLFFKTANEPWNKPEFRNALLTAVPFEKIRNNYPVKATTLTYPLPSYPKLLGVDYYDAEEAADLMKQARKNAGIPKNKKLPLVFAVSDGVEHEQEWAKILKEAWEPLGVQLIIQSTPVHRYNYSIKDWNADLFIYSWVGDYADPLAFLELFKTGSSFNESGYSNEKFDELLKDAAKTSSSEHYKTLSKAEQMLLDDGIIIPVAHSISYHVINLNKIGGWYINALDIHPLKHLYFNIEEKPETNRLFIKSLKDPLL